MKKVIFLICTLYCNIYAMEIQQTTRQQKKQTYSLPTRQCLDRKVYAEIRSAHQANLTKVKPSELSPLSQVEHTKVNIQEVTLSSAHADIKKTEPDTNKWSHKSYACCGFIGCECAAFGTATATLMSNGIPDPCCMACCCCKIPVPLGIQLAGSLGVCGIMLPLLGYLVLSHACSD